jgi:hypothetical protein
LASSSTPTEYHQKSAVRLLWAKPGRNVLVLVDRKPVKLKPEMKYAGQ